MAHKEELGQLITLEQGKPLKEAMGEVSDFIVASRTVGVSMDIVYFRVFTES